MAKVEYATKEDMDRLERKIDLILRDVRLIKQEIEYLGEEELEEIEEISKRIKEGEEEIISLEDFKKRYGNEV